MKKLIFFLCLILLAHSIHYDLTHGSLQVFEYTKNGLQNKEQAYRIVVVPPGGTVLSIVKQIHTEELSIEEAQIKQDFEKLNKGIKADAIVAHQKYKFPVYE